MQKGFLKDGRHDDVHMSTTIKFQSSAIMTNILALTSAFLNSVACSWITLSLSRLSAVFITFFFDMVNIKLIYGVPAQPYFVFCSQ